jgi:hypothetical protein
VGEKPVLIRLQLEAPLVRRIDRWAEQRFPDRLEACRFLLNFAAETIMRARRVADQRGQLR